MTLTLLSTVGAKMYRLKKRFNKHSICATMPCLYRILSISNLNGLLALFNLILYVPGSTNFQLCRDGSSLVEPVLSRG